MGVTTQNLSKLEPQYIRYWRKADVLAVAEVVEGVLIFCANVGKNPIYPRPDPQGRQRLVSKTTGAFFYQKP